MRSGQPLTLAPSLRRPWYKDAKGKPGPTLFELLDSTEIPVRDALAPFRMAVIDKFKDLGTVVMGKSEAGCVRKGDTLLVMPNKYAPSCACPPPPPPPRPTTRTSVVFLNARTHALGGSARWQNLYGRMVQRLQQ